MTIVELLAAVGADNLAYQKLDECVLRAERVRRGTKITFGTAIVGPENFVSGEPRSHVGFVVWVPVEHAKRVQAQIDADAAQHRFSAGHFLIFFPQDGHLAAQLWNKPCKVRKFIAKVAVDTL